MNHTDTDWDWDYDLLQEGVAALEREARICNAANDHPRREAMMHAAAFIEYHVREGEILSPLQNYIINK